MTLKTLVTGVAAAALVGGAAAGVTSIAFSAGSSAPGAVAVQPVVWDIPMPQAPPAQLQAPLLQTLQALAGGGSFAGKAPYIQGGIGRIEGIAADRAYNRAAAEGKFPLTFNVANIDQSGRRGQRRRHRNVCSWHNRHPERPVRARPEPQRLADIEGVRFVVALGGRLINRVHRTLCRSPGRRHDSGGARA